MNKIECLICGKSFVNFKAHLLFSHGFAEENVNVYLKENNLPSCVPFSRKKSDKICQYCGCIFKNLKSHIKYSHKDIKIPVVINPKNTLNCEICNLKFSFLERHAKLKHSMSWPEYCLKFKYTGPKMVHSKEHKELVKKNKLHFYGETEQGQELKKAHRKFWQTNNPSQSIEFKQKQSKRMSNLLKHDNTLRFSSYGLSINFIYENKEYRVRSFFEFTCIYELLLLKKDFLYEKETISYEHNSIIKTYICDLVIDGVYYELKSNKNSIDTEKYKEIKTAFESSKKVFKLIDYKDFCNLFSIEEKGERFYLDILRDLWLNNQILKMASVIRHGKSHFKVNYIVNCDALSLNDSRLKLSWSKNNEFRKD